MPHATDPQTTRGEHGTIGASRPARGAGPTVGHRCDHPEPESITIDRRHNGPPGSAHGGVAAGRIASLIDGNRAIVRLLAPVPLETALVPRARADGAFDVCAGPTLIATVRRLDERLVAAPFPEVSEDEVRRAEAGWPGASEHPFPTCFACGPARCDGLGLRPGPLDGRRGHATRWDPGVDGPLPSWLVWAALDCPSGAPAIAARPGTAMVTGELAVDIREQVRGDEPHVIVSREAGRSGRRIFTEAAVLGPDHRVRALARATWFAIEAEVAP